ncbi:gamma carbonic anhydrase family protein [Pseudonocardia alni]|uniref:gamma carbonic anhydrase family protein n=1 Tax=Pseudonocardia alni TaxID=33907 RepID=UPI00280B327D|nr:gamma carbonic anhydrase family protein [Pseudonocardia alni]
MTDPVLVGLPAGEPDVDPTAWVAPGAVLAGAVRLGEEVGIWYTAVLRADAEPIVVGRGSNIQDGSVLHTDAGFPLTVGAGVSVGHRAVLHGCTVGDDTLVGMGSVVMNGARIGRHCLVAAGALVLEGTEVPDGSLVAGVPAKVRRTLTDEERAGLTANAENYRRLARLHARRA